MFRTRLFGASLVLSVLINIAIVAGLGVLGPSARLLPSAAPLKAIRVQVYHPPVAKPQSPKPAAKPHPTKQAKKPPPAHHKVRVVRATPAPPSTHPHRKIAASRPASSGRQPVRVAAPIRPITPPSTPAKEAHEVAKADTMPAPAAPP